MTHVKLIHITQVGYIITISLIKSNLAAFNYKAASAGMKKEIDVKSIFISITFMMRAGASRHREPGEHGLPQNFSN